MRVGCHGERSRTIGTSIHGDMFNAFINSMLQNISLVISILNIVDCIDVPVVRLRSR